MADELARTGVSISPAIVQCGWLRDDLETMKKRRNRLNAKNQPEWLVLTESEVVAAEYRTASKEDHGEFESVNVGSVNLSV